MGYWEKKIALGSQCFLLSKFFCVNIFRIFSGYSKKKWTGVLEGKASGCIVGHLAVYFRMMIAE